MKLLAALGGNYSVGVQGPSQSVLFPRSTSEGPTLVSVTSSFYSQTSFPLLKGLHPTAEVSSLPASIILVLYQERGDRRDLS